MIDQEIIKLILQIVLTVATCLVGGYKVTRSVLSRDKAVEELIKERDSTIQEYIDEKLVLTRSNVFEGSANLADDSEGKGYTKIGMRVKCIPAKMSFDAFLEKIDRNTKDVLLEDLGKYFHKNYIRNKYEDIATDKKKLDDQILENAHDFKQALWTRLSKEVGYSLNFKEAYNAGFTDEDAIETCRKIMNFMLKQHSIFRVKIKQEQKFFRSKKGSRR